jgi:hypothetical protein
MPQIEGKLFERKLLGTKLDLLLASKDGELQ